ncbi:MAG: GtrA family protein, partial [Nitratireductor sp.]|nr:GtrA family protein [Nitratireductor sp.]
LHRNVTFRSTASVGQSLPKFLAISVLGFVLCQLIVVMMVNVMGFSYAAALAVMVTTVPVVTYVLSRIWAFRDGHF